MKTEVIQILGKRITGFSIKFNRANEPPQSQLFLLFEDGGVYEFYSRSGYIVATSGVRPDRGITGIRAYMAPQMQTVFEAVLDAEGNVEMHRFFHDGSAAHEVFPLVSGPGAGKGGVR